MYGIIADYDFVRDAIVFYDRRGIPNGAMPKYGLRVPYEAFSEVGKSNEELALRMNRINMLRTEISKISEEILGWFAVEIPPEGKPMKVTLPNGTVLEADTEMY